MKVIDTKSFIEKANKVHDGNYYYSLVNYTKSKDKVKIICKVHGVFEQAAYNHSIGHGCINCRDDALREERRIKTSDLILKLQQSSCKDLDFSKVVAGRSMHDKVEVVCNKHGSFMCSPNNIIWSGNGCPLCEHKGGFKNERTGYFYIVTSSKHVKVGITNRPNKGRLQKLNLQYSKLFSEDLQEIFRLKFFSGEDCNTFENEILSFLRGISKNPTERFDGFRETFGIEILDQLINFVKNNYIKYDKVEEIIIESKEETNKSG